MKLKEACEYALACDLSTVGEAVYNIRIHAPSLFTYDKLHAELEELAQDAEHVPDNILISVILGG